MNDTDAENRKTLRAKIIQKLLHSLYMAILLYGAFAIGQDFQVIAATVGAPALYGYLALIAFLSPVILEKFGFLDQDSPKS